MATTFELTLTSQTTGISDVYDAEFPTQVAARVSHIERADEATIEDALTDGELGYQLDNGQLVGYFNSEYVRAQLLSADVFNKLPPVEIGTWNMDGTASVTIANAGFPGLTFANFRFALVTINEDDDIGPPYHKYDFISQGAGSVKVDSVNGDVILERIASSFFDSVNFDKTSYNRGQIHVWYEP